MLIFGAVSEACDPLKYRFKLRPVDLQNYNIYENVNIFFKN